MSQVYNEQTLLQLQLDTKDDLSAAISPTILFKRPDGTKGEWVGTIIGSEIVYDVQATDFVPGMWIFQAKYTVAGKVAYGDIATRNIQLNLEV